MSQQPDIAHYRIIGKLGEGGMGAVYRATDTKLNRDVAIKVLPDAFADDRDRMVRFAREAQVLASLNHPNIAAIHGVEERAIVMELVEGQTLAGPLPVEDALPVIRQLIDALEYAHEKGVVHRDLKPANIIVTPEGRVKVLDFGLAKAMSGEGSQVNPANSPTLTMGATTAGVIMGTAGYMSPEQARGHQVDKRADIWAFGVVVHELLTGKQLFEGPTVSDTLASVLRQEPDFTAVPAQLRRLVRSCLVRDPRLRMRDIGDARLMLEDSPESTAAVGARQSRLFVWTTAAMAVVALLLAGALWRASRPVDRPLIRLNAQLDANAIYDRFVTAAISSDGTRIAYKIRAGGGGPPQLATRLLHQSAPAVLAGTENGEQPFFSPDGQWIGFFQDTKLKKISAQGGAVVTLCDAPLSRGASWGTGGDIVFATVSSLFRVSETGGTPQNIFRGSNTSRLWWPQILPASDSLLVTINELGIDFTFEKAKIAVFLPKTEQLKIVQENGYLGRYLPSGHLTYIREGALWGVAFDLSRFETRGNATPLLEDMARTGRSRSSQYECSQSGTLVYLSGGTQAPLQPMVWMDSAGKKEAFRTFDGFGVRISPDGKRVAVSENGDLAVVDTERDTVSRITFNPGALARNPVWSPDGKHIGYAAGEAIWWIRSDGSAQPQKLYEKKGAATPWSFSPDGSRLVFHQSAESSTRREIWILPLDLTDPDRPKPGKAEPFFATPQRGVEPTFSPDGRWLAYASQETPTLDVFVRAVSGEGKWQISNNGARFPVWSRNGRDLFFETVTGQVMVVDYISKAGVFVPGKPRLWSDVPIERTGNFQNYDVHPDGKRILAIPQKSDEGQGGAHVVFLFNFLDELKRKIP